MQPLYIVITLNYLEDSSSPEVSALGTVFIQFADAMEAVDAAIAELVEPAEYAVSLEIIGDGATIHVVDSDDTSDPDAPEVLTFYVKPATLAS